MRERRSRARARLSFGRSRAAVEGETLASLMKLRYICIVLCKFLYLYINNLLIYTYMK